MKQVSMPQASRVQVKKAGHHLRNGFSDVVLACDMIVSNPEEVTAYLKKHAALRSILPAVFKKVRRKFGPETELSLALYRDPEIEDTYLTLTLRQMQYDPHFDGFH